MAPASPSAPPPGAPAPALDAASAALLERARAAFAGSGGLLEAASWPREIETEFFASNAQKLPEPTYTVDRAAAEARLAKLDALEKELTGDDALVRLLRRRVESQRLGARMLLVLGTKAFSDLSREAYGSARSTWLDGDTTNLDFAKHLANRLGPAEALHEDEEQPRHFDATALSEYLEERLAKRKDRPKLDIFLDESLGAKALAGKKRLRIRADATFELEEARSLYLHEIETHVFTAQNGDAQPHLDFLDTGGPLSTRTQEGLAVFTELYAQALTLKRLRRLIDRVHLVSLAEDGASFIELYRHLLEGGSEPRAAYLDAVRICRGGRCEGGAPFTKDACYLSGLIEVYDFLRIAMRHDGKHIAEVLVSGRLALDELEPLLALREDGILAPPRYVPSWLKRWDDLVAHFAFSSFLGEIDLAFVARKYTWLDERPHAPSSQAPAVHPSAHTGPAIKRASRSG